MYQNPYYPQQIQQMQSMYGNNQLIRVAGLDGAKAYQLGANSTVALFDNNSDVFYVKSTDMAGFPTIRVFKFEEMSPTCSKTEQVDYVSRKEMEEYVKQFISKSAKQNDTVDESCE